MVFALALPPSVFGAQKTFDGGSTGTGTAWRTAGNWSGDSLPAWAGVTAVDNIVVGDLGGGTQAITGQTVLETLRIQDLTLTNTVSRILENGTGTAGRTSLLVLSGGRSGVTELINHTGSALFTIRNGTTAALELRLETSGDVKVGTGATLSLLSAITGTGGIKKTGAGSLLIGLATPLDSINSNYSGGFTVSEGLVRTNISSTRSGTTIVTGPFGTGTLTLEGGTLRSNTATDRSYHNSVNLKGSIVLGATSTGTQTFVNTALGTTALTANSSLETVTDTTWNQTITASTSGLSLSKSGDATLTLAGGGSWDGTTVSAGTLLANSTLTLNTLTVSTSATLGGNGSVSGTATVSGNLSPGSLATAGTTGTLSLANLALASTAKVAFDLTGGAIAGSADLLDVSGTLDLGSSILDLVQLGTYAVGNKFTLFVYDGSLTGTFAGLGDEDEFTSAGGLWKINYNDDTAGSNGGTGTNFITITAVPEPAAAMLGGLGILMLLNGRRRIR